MSDTLQAVNVPIVSNSTAQTLYPMETVTADQLAAVDTGNGGEDARQADSGGPLTVAKGSSRILAGVVSWGYGCAEAQHPGLYARVASFRSWISSALASIPVVLDSRTNLSGSAATWQHFAHDVVVRVWLPERDPAPGGDFRALVEIDGFDEPYSRYFVASTSYKRSSPGAGLCRKS
nr:trypsin-like serine protease [Sorangium cellulosum]